MDLGHTLGYLELLVGGGLLSLYLYVKEIKAGGRLLGISSATLGVLGLVSSLLGFDGTAYYTIWVTFGLALLGVIYVEFKKPVIVLILAIPFYVLSLTFLLSLPFIILFISLAFEVGLLDAYRLGKYEATRSAGRTLEKEHSNLIAPFHVIRVLTRRLSPGQSTPSLIFASYSLLPMILIFLVSIFWLVVGPSYASYGIVIVIGGYFAVVNASISKAK